MERKMKAFLTTTAMLGLMMLPMQAQQTPDKKLLQMPKYYYTLHFANGSIKENHVYNNLEETLSNLHDITQSSLDRSTHITIQISKHPVFVYFPDDPSK
jgi:hypothetical protein